MKVVSKPVGDFLALAALGFALENCELALLAPGHSDLVHGLQAHVLARAASGQVNNSTTRIMVYKGFFKIPSTRNPYFFH